MSLVCQVLGFIITQVDAVVDRIAVLQAVTANTLENALLDHLFSPALEIEMDPAYHKYHVPLSYHFQPVDTTERRLTR